MERWWTIDREARPEPVHSLDELLAFMQTHPYALIFVDEDLADQLRHFAAKHADGGLVMERAIRVRGWMEPGHLTAVDRMEYPLAEASVN